jgi:hypothetical protein
MLAAVGSSLDGNSLNNLVRTPSEGRWNLLQVRVLRLHVRFAERSGHSALDDSVLGMTAYDGASNSARSMTHAPSIGTFSAFAAARRS